MLIIGETGAKADFVQEAAASIDLSPQIGARLVHVQPHILRLCRRIERIAEGNAIKAVEMADREAQITAFCDKGYAPRNIPGPRGAVGELAFEVSPSSNSGIAAPGRLSPERGRQDMADRKSTRLNSSHSCASR